MNPGDFREVITIKNPDTQASDQYGQSNPDPYATDGTLKAAMDTTGGASTEQGGAERAQDRIQARVRRPLPSGIAIKENTRIEWEGEDYDVETWQRIGRRRRVLEIDAVRT